MDANGNGFGDLAVVRSRLDHLAGAPHSLDVDAIWLSPFYQSPMMDVGYDVASHCAVDPRFGTLTDFDRLLAAAQARDAASVQRWHVAVRPHVEVPLRRDVGGPQPVQRRLGVQRRRRVNDQARLAGKVAGMRKSPSGDGQERATAALSATACGIVMPPCCCLRAFPRWDVSLLGRRSGPITAE